MAIRDDGYTEKSSEETIGTYGGHSTTVFFRYSNLFQDEQVSLADILRHLMIKYDNIFKVSDGLSLSLSLSLFLSSLQCAFPFGMGWLGAPTGEELTQVGRDYSHWQLHLIVHPPLLRLDIPFSLSSLSLPLQIVYRTQVHGWI